MCLIGMLLDLFLGVVKERMIVLFYRLGNGFRESIGIGLIGFLEKLR